VSRNSNFNAGANGGGSNEGANSERVDGGFVDYGGSDTGIHQGPQMTQGPALAQGGPPEAPTGWEGGALSDIWHVAKNPTQTPFVGGAVRVGSSLARTATSFLTAGGSELTGLGYGLANAAVTDADVSDSLKDFYAHTPIGIAQGYATGTAQGLYQGGRLAAFIASNPSEAYSRVGKWGSWAATHRNEARHQIASVTSRTGRQMAQDYYEHPERAVIDVGLTVGTAGAAAIAVRGARAARAARAVGEAAEIGSVAARTGAEIGELGTAASEATARAAATAGREVAAGGEAGTAAAEAGAAGAAGATADVASEGRFARFSRAFSERMEKFDTMAEKGIQKRIERRPANLARRALGQEPKVYGRIGARQEALAQRVAGEGGTARQLIGQRLSPSPFKPEFTDRMSEWGRAYGEMKWRRQVMTGEIETAGKVKRLGDVGESLGEANKAVRDPQGYVMEKLNNMLGANLTPEQIAAETDRRQKEDQQMPSNLPPPQRLPNPSPLPNPTRLNQPPSGPPAPPGSGNAGGNSPTGGNQYRSGRGWSGGMQGPLKSKKSKSTGFWEGRPEFTGAAFNYNRMQIRPLTVQRRNSTTRFDLAMAETLGAMRNGRREGNEGNFEPVGDEVGGPPRSRLSNEGAIENPNAWIHEREPTNYQAESDAWDAAHPNVTSIGMELTNNDTQMPTVGRVVKTVGKSIITKEGRARAKAAYNEVRGGGVPPGSAVPSELEEKPPF
jgi:hypothetical protein